MTTSDFVTDKKVMKSPKLKKHHQGLFKCKSQTNPWLQQTEALEAAMDSKNVRIQIPIYHYYLFIFPREEYDIIRQEIG